MKSRNPILPSEAVEFDTAQKGYMARALELAQKGEGWTSPNPMVGAVLVKEGKIIGEGWHRKYGGLHAEREALKACSESAEGADLYVTLEPCCHTGKQPPCTEAILAAKIGRVFVGSLDPNPLVAGKGIRILQENGIPVKTGLLEKECRDLNRIFFHSMTQNRPYVTLKYAMTLDGKIAASNGDSKWITGEAARKRVHEERHRHMAIMAGIGTVLADDPLLTCRLENGRDPIRIICDTHLKTPLESQLVKSAREIPLILAAGISAQEKAQPYLQAGCQVWLLPQKDGGIDLQALMKRLHEEKIDSVLVEGGGTLNASLLEEGLADHVQAWIAPKIIGGTGKTPVQGAGLLKMADAFRLENMHISQAGEDFLLEGDIIHPAAVFHNPEAL